jgi:plastocyanin
MNKWLAVFFSALALGLVVAGCGSSDNKSSSSSSSSGGSSSTKTTAPAASTGGGKTASVQMKNIAFTPTAVTVAKGGTVKWTNEDTVGHDVTKKSGPGPKFSSGAAGGLQKGDTFQQKFTTAGTVHYVCTVHPNMQATVTVK